MSTRGEPQSRCRFPSWNSTVDEGEVVEDREQHAPPLRNGDRIRPDLGESAIVDGSTRIRPGVCAREGGKQGDDRKKRLLHMIERSGRTGGRKRFT